MKATKYSIVDSSCLFHQKIALREVESNNNCKATAVAAISTGIDLVWAGVYLVRPRSRVESRVAASMQPEAPNSFEVPILHNC